MILIAFECACCADSLFVSLFTYDHDYIIARVCTGAVGGQSFGRGTAEVITLLEANGPSALDPASPAGISTAAAVDALLEKLASGGERRKVKIPKVCSDLFHLMSPLLLS